MTNIEKLKQFLENVVVPDLEKEINTLFEMAEQDGMMSLGDREELEELQMMHRECVEMLIDIEAETMEEAEAEEIIASLKQ
jgi:hypothetical protein